LETGIDLTTFLLPLLIKDEDSMLSYFAMSLDGMFNTFPTEWEARLEHEDDSEKRLYVLKVRFFGKLNEDGDSFGELLCGLLVFGCVLSSVVLSLHPLL
jgi:hypothetical protein